MDNRFARKLLTVTGARIALELRGIKCLPFDLSSAKKHSITCSRSFGQTVSEYEQIKEAVLYFLTRASEKMRSQNLAAQSITVFISTDRFRPVPAPYANTATYSANCATDSNQEIQQWAIQTLEKIYKPHYEYRKAGIILNGLVPAGNLTKRMFDDAHFEKQHKLMKAMDEETKNSAKIPSDSPTSTRTVVGK
ncbi:Y-family DNA polymerase [Biomphalaria pfeifferi]|uniref:Y-family DNA polymerase n=1 Tax=Biomphalaria pfeifferi TaxID=112525 RepID=A0AAD8EU83_BIOPF|nr:Y-family DNA polymerase [Biomphalaria pfeifferi]